MSPSSELLDLNKARSSLCRSAPLEAGWEAAGDAEKSQERRAFLEKEGESPGKKVARRPCFRREVSKSITWRRGQVQKKLVS